MVAIFWENPVVAVIKAVFLQPLNATFVHLLMKPVAGRFWLQSDFASM